MGGWQAQTERKWLAELLADKKSAKPLLKILQTTEIGGIDGAKERELERKQKSDQPGEDLLE